MKNKIVFKTLREVYELADAGHLNPDPIGQRPPVSHGYDKSHDIIKSLFGGFGIGMITLRDISEDEAMQKVYPGVRYLVVDGGHRIRAIASFLRNKFRVDKRFYRELSNEEKEAFDNIQLVLDTKVCTSAESIEVFRNLNKTTDVNFMEMLMCDDESPTCRIVRSMTRPYKEYGNIPLGLFNTTFNKDGEEKSMYFDMAPNHRRKWDEYGFIALIKAAGGGNVAAGQPAILEMAENTPNLSKNTINVATRFFEDIENLCDYRGRSRKLNSDIFAALQLVWFGFYEKNKNFKIDEIGLFHDKFFEAYAVLTGNSPSHYDNETIIYGKGEDVSKHDKYFVKEFMRKNCKNFANDDVQKICANYFLDELGSDCGVVFRDEKRSLSTRQREEYLAKQGFKCAIDGLPLKLEDSVWGHDTAWAKGGNLMDGAVIRRTHNTDMGSCTLDEYRLILKMRTQAKG
jgi:hypothetical protein